MTQRAAALLSPSKPCKYFVQQHELFHNGIGPGSIGESQATVRGCRELSPARPRRRSDARNESARNEAAFVPLRNRMRVCRGRLERRCISRGDRARAVRGYNGDRCICTERGTGLMRWRGSQLSGSALPPPQSKDVQVDSRYRAVAAKVTGRPSRAAGRAPIQPDVVQIAGIHHTVQIGVPRQRTERRKQSGSIVIVNRPIRIEI